MNRLAAGGSTASKVGAARTGEDGVPGGPDVMRKRHSGFRQKQGRLEDGGGRGWLEPGHGEKCVGEPGKGKEADQDTGEGTRAGIPGLEGREDGEEGGGGPGSVTDRSRC